MKYHHHYHFDVERWLILSVAEGSSASSGIRSLRIGRYTYNEIGGTWKDASKACKKERAHLLTLETTAEWNNVTEDLKALQMTVVNGFTHFFIGLRKVHGTWKWTEAGSPGVTVTRDDSRWQKGEPSRDSREVCGEVNSLYQNQYGHFNNVQCDLDYVKESGASRGYICEDM